MVHYIGLDVSLKQTSICVVNQLGSVVREGVVDSEPEAIAAFVRSKAPRVVRIGLETGPTATWLWTELKRLGLPVIFLDARHRAPKKWAAFFFSHAPRHLGRSWPWRPAHAAGYTAASIAADHPYFRCSRRCGRCDDLDNWDADNGGGGPLDHHTVADLAI